MDETVSGGAGGVKVCVDMNPNPSDDHRHDLAALGGGTVPAPDHV